MNPSIRMTRRALLRRLAGALSLAPLATRAASQAATAALPLVSESDPQAKMLHYVEDARRASGASAGASCESCSLYSGASGADRGSCTLFPGKLVKAAGWCSSWSSL
jgi:mevalonate pyrophosphate decarboxylase